MAVINQKLEAQYALYHADCMEVLPALPANSVGLAVYSPPFPELYQYSDDPRDMSNCTHYGEAIEQYRYVVKEIARLLVPGRITCVHATDLKRDQIRQRDFPGDIIRVHEDAGLDYFCRLTIWKDPWEFARRTRMTTLMHKTTVEDSSKSRIAPADYLLVFRKHGEAAPVTHPLGFREYAGGRPMPAEIAKYAGTSEQRKNVFSHWIYRQYASPVWMDIRRGRLLPYVAARENNEEKHVCPLQLDVIDRCLELWSNQGDTVLSPFMGVGSEIYEAVRLKRKGIGIELKETYYRQAVRNIDAAVLDAEPRAFQLETEIEGPQDDDADGLTDHEPEAEEATC